jgi:hypothetical protein
MTDPLRAASRQPLTLGDDIPLLRYSAWDAILIGVSLLPPVAFGLVPSIPVVAVGIWWTANTVSHNFIHLPFFRSGSLNRAYSLYLSLILGFPQTLWRDRHLAHHAGQGMAFRWKGQLVAEFVLVFTVWAAFLGLAPRLFFFVYVPGYVLGLGLCYIHGYFEHARGTTSHYGSFYNFWFFNDGYHVEHHARPAGHWSQLPGAVPRGGPESRWPPVLRWLDEVSIEGLERIAVRRESLQKFLLVTHERALRRLLREFPCPRRIVIVGGGLFPRTALLLGRMFPGSRMVIVDGNAANIETAKAFLQELATDVEYEHRTFEVGTSEEADLVVIPLSLMGSREEIYRNPPAPAILIHDWIWAKRGNSAVVSLLLLKRLNLLRTHECTGSQL